MKEFVIVSDIKAEIKLWLNIFMKDVACLGSVMLITMVCSMLFPTEQQKQLYLFWGLGVFLAIYLDLRPKQNPGKRNFEIIYMLLINREPKLFKSYGYYEFDKK